jgi:hypothetical protein
MTIKIYKIAVTKQAGRTAVSIITRSLLGALWFWWQKQQEKPVLKT